MIELRDDQKLERIIRVHGVEAPVVVKITPHELVLKVKGSRKEIWLSWTQAVSHATTGTDVPSYLFDKPLELLKHYAAEYVERKKEQEKENE